MEFDGGKKDVVDPEVRAYVSSLVSALGGNGADEEGRYVLGDDASACLRDLKKWLKLYDEKANRLDVARCLAESNLVGGDLLQILAAWPEDATQDRLKSKIALSCLELLVPLTWPLEKSIDQMTVNHHRHIPYLQIAQLGYKKSVINYDGARILHTALRCALPSMAEAVGDRSTRDEGIIKLVLYFLRNIAMISPLPNVQFDGDEAEISRSATIDAFHSQDIFQLLLTVSSSMGEDFNTQDVVALEIIFHIIKGVDAEILFQDEEKAGSVMVDELVRLRQKEAAAKRSLQNSAPSRHNRFGAMAWLQRDNAKMTTISGQAALTDAARGLAKMDSTKIFRPPRRAPKGESGPLDFDTPVTLSAEAIKQLRGFVVDFLDAGFNPLFNHIRKAIDREAQRVLEYHPRQFFYLVSWFLNAERVRRRSKKESKAPKSKSSAPDDMDDSFALVASVLNQEMFVTLNRTMSMTYENKMWPDLSATMKCFTQILLTVQEMSESPLEEDQDIAENILNRIFYEEETHDRVAVLTRTYKDQGFGYLDSCTDLTHNYLRILEQYSKQNVDMQVRSRRRVRRKKKAAADAGEDDDNDDIDDSDGEDEARATRTTHERKFDFKRFASRFMSQGCVDTFVSFTTYYNDLKPAQLKRAHRFFYRIAFKQEMSVMLFRVDIIALLYKMIKGPEGLDPQGSSFKEWDELVKQLIKKCTRKIQQRPELVVELLFSKTTGTAHYLEYGYEKQTVATKPRAAAELEVKPGMEWEEQVGVVVGAILDRNEAELLEWLKSQLSSAEPERRSWEGASQTIASVEKDPLEEIIDPFEEAIDPPATTTDPPATVAEPPKAPSILIKADDEICRLALFKNGFLRLLMTLLGFQRIGLDDDPDASWVIPSTMSADQIKEALSLIKKFEFSPPLFDDGKEASEFIKRKNAAVSSRKRATFDDEDDGIDDDEEEPLFAAGGPTARKKSADALEALKKNRRRRRREGSDEDNGITDEQLEARAAARKQRELEKNRRIKSELFVHDSDDETDEERDRIFFEQEEKLRQANKVNIMKELMAVEKLNKIVRKGQAKKRQSSAITADSDDDDDDDDVLTSRRKRQSSAISVDSDDEVAEASERSTPAARDNVLAASDDEATDTPMSSPHARSSQPKRRKLSSDAETASPEPSAVEKAVPAGEAMSDDEDEDEDAALAARPARNRVRAGFIVDSSDEE